MHDLSRGDALEAVDHNSLMLMALPLVILSALRWVAGSPQPAVLGKRLTGWIVLVTVAAWTVLRNLPVESLAHFASS